MQCAPACNCRKVQMCAAPPRHFRCVALLPLGLERPARIVPLAGIRRKGQACFGEPKKLGRNMPLYHGKHTLLMQSRGRTQRGRSARAGEAVGRAAPKGPCTASPVRARRHTPQGRELVRRAAARGAEAVLPRMERMPWGATTRRVELCVTNGTRTPGSPQSRGQGASVPCACRRKLVCVEGGVSA